MKEKRFKMRAAAHLFLMKGNEILLHLRKNSSFEGMYSVVAGHLDGGETAMQTMIREAREEAGISIKEEDLRFGTVSHSNAANNEFVQFFFVCDKWSGAITNTEPHKCGGLEFCPVDKLPENVVPYVREAIKQVASGNTYYEFGWGK